MQSMEQKTNRVDEHVINQCLRIAGAVFTDSCCFCSSTMTANSLDLSSSDNELHTNRCHWRKPPMSLSDQRSGFSNCLSILKRIDGLQSAKPAQFQFRMFIGLRQTFLKHIKNKHETMFAEWKNKQNHTSVDKNQPMIIDLFGKTTDKCEWLSRKKTNDTIAHCRFDE